MNIRRQLVLLIMIILTVACGAPEPVATPATPAATDSAASLGLPAGYLAVPVVTGLSRPTQFIAAGDGRLWIAQLFRGEGDGAGQIISVNLADGTQELLLESLDKPTGIALLDNALWIATRDELLRAPLDETGRPGTPQVILADLPNNGRSNGTLTVTLDGTLLFATSGRRQGNEAAPDSGTLWELNPAAPQNPVPLATGLKNAYAHAFDGDGRLWSTEIGDGAVTGADYSGQPPEELNLIVPGADYGWPRCFGDQEPVLNRNGSPALCADTFPSAALFPPQTTPTSIVSSPFTENVLLIAFWLGEEVLALPIESTPDGPIITSPTPFISGLQNPQHLLVTSSGTLLVSDYGSGTIYEISK